MTAERVYIRFSEHLIGLGEGIDVLSYAGTSRRNDVTAIPSWVPDWSGQSLEGEAEVIVKNKGTRFSAGGSSKPAIRIMDESVEPNKIAIEGILTGCIAALSDKLWPVDTIEPSMHP